MVTRSICRGLTVLAIGLTLAACGAASREGRPTRNQLRSGYSMGGRLLAGHSCAWPKRAPKGGEFFLTQLGHQRCDRWFVPQQKGAKPGVHSFVPAENWVKGSAAENVESGQVPLVGFYASRSSTHSFSFTAKSTHMAYFFACISLTLVRLEVSKPYRFTWFNAPCGYHDAANQGIVPTVAGRRYTMKVQTSGPAEWALEVVPVSTNYLIEGG